MYGSFKNVSTRKSSYYNSLEVGLGLGLGLGLGPYSFLARAFISQ